MWWESSLHIVLIGSAFWIRLNILGIFVFKRVKSSLHDLLLIITSYNLVASRFFQYWTYLVEIFSLIIFEIFLLFT